MREMLLMGCLCRGSDGRCEVEAATSRLFQKAVLRGVARFGAAAEARRRAFHIISWLFSCLEVQTKVYAQSILASAEPR